MPADRSRDLRRDDRSDYGSEDFMRSPPSSAEAGAGFSFAPNVTPTTFFDPPSIMEGSLADGGLFPVAEPKETTNEKRGAHGRKKPSNHIPRPPNAFILFRSAFIKSQHVSTGVETNHSTLSKIIGLTWQNLPNEERQVWHARAKVAQEEHKRRFPQYAFRPIHNKARGTAAEKRKLREVGPKDQERCAKIAELLVRGKKGQELEDAIVEFDRHHVREVVTRFETPITADNFELTISTPSSATSSARATPAIDTPPPRRTSLPVTSLKSRGFSPYSNASQDFARLKRHSMDDSSSHSFNASLFYSTPSFELDTGFVFPAQQASTTLPSADEGHSSFDVHQSFVPSISVTTHSLDLLCDDSQYSNAEDWTRQGTPSSASTCSMPSTPSFIETCFPEQYSTFPCDGANFGLAHNEPSYVVDNQFNVQMTPSDFTMQFEPQQPIPQQPQQVTFLRADTDFSLFMEPMPGYL
ncbi:hypothetical protein CVT24_010358 [Panaeolus cyanescens]|uniref:HMG box domain-containing protein n=1 Tax=Panaeolus cyanescens TaxID=181874 RepID=A0A409VAI0_9AGAR|nr:hypothetical protein CVT24_010358 [Panaeolus cyanescens]